MTFERAVIDLGEYQGFFRPHISCYLESQEVGRTCNSSQASRGIGLTSFEPSASKDLEINATS